MNAKKARNFFVTSGLTLWLLAGVSLAFAQTAGTEAGADIKIGSAAAAPAAAAQGRAESVPEKTGAPAAFTRIFYYLDGKRSRASLFAHPNSIDVLAPQAYSIDASGALSGGVDRSILDFAAAHKIKVMPLVTNSRFSSNHGHAFLDDMGKQTATIDALVSEAAQKHYSGWQIDFEQLDASYRDRFSDFAARFGKTLRENGLVSSVAVIAQTSVNPDDYPQGLWQNLVGVYDYAALSASTDFLSVMSYDDPGSKGPVARYSWLKDVIAHSVRYAPTQKLSLGIPLYYWRWDTGAQKLVGVGGYSSILKVLKKYKTARSYSQTEQAEVITYKKRGRNYAIWHENAKSIKRKLKLIKENGLHGFSAWALGLEPPEIHAVLRR